MSEKNYSDLNALSRFLYNCKNLFVTKDEVKAKLDISQGVEYAGMVMGVDESGNITPTSAQMTEIVYHEEDQIVEIVTFSDSDIEKQLASI